MKTAKEVIEIARSKLGQLYLFGADVDLADKHWRGPWDCAEFLSWVAYQATGRVFGCIDNAVKIERVEPATIGWVADLRSELVMPIAIEEALATPAAVLVRAPSRGARIGHVALSNGLGGTIEAHSARLGVVEVAGAATRRWTHAGKLRDVEYPGVQALAELDEAVVLKRHSHGQAVLDCQKALRVLAARTGMAGFHPGPPDGYYGPKTQAAVYVFQLARGIQADGEVGPESADALGITLGG